MFIGLEWRVLPVAGADVCNAEGGVGGDGNRWMEEISEADVPQEMLEVESVVFNPCLVVEAIRIVIITGGLETLSRTRKRETDWVRLGITGNAQGL